VLSEIDHEPFVGHCALHVPILSVEPGTFRLLDSIELVIRASRVVVEEDQVFDLCRYRELTGLPDETVPPALLGRQVTLEILGIVNQHVCLLTKLDKLVKPRGLFIRWFELIIRQVDDGPSRMLDPIAGTSTRMIRRNPLEAALTFLENSLASLHETEDLGRDILRCNRKVRAIHLIEGRTPQRVPHRRWQERDLTMRLIERGKKRESLDMVPMGM
jgi:hypothetical protein